MKLYHYHFGQGVENFGDDLNRWLWPKMLPGLLDADPRVALVGIGTLLNEHLREATPLARRRLIFSTGVGYGSDTFRLGSCDRVYCVRGPLSAQALGLSPDAAVTDGAALVRRFVKPSGPKYCEFAFMPHIEQIADIAWQSVCAELGIGYIDPRWPTERVLEGISRTGVLLAEAMHGAIVADVLRVPWVPLVTHPHILPFKWQDWCASVGVDYRPECVPTLWNSRQTRDLKSPVRDARDWSRRKKALARLAQIMRDTPPTLSRDSDLDRVTERLEERLDQLKSNILSGEFEASQPRFPAYLQAAG